MTEMTRGEFRQHIRNSLPGADAGFKDIENWLQAEFLPRFGSDFVGAANEMYAILTKTPDVTSLNMGKSLVEIKQRNRRLGHVLETLAVTQP